MNLAQILSVAIPSVIAVIGVWLSALYLRKSQRESNVNTANANDTNAFKVVTDQLFADNAVLRGELAELREEVTALKESVATKDETIGRLEDELEDTDNKWRRQIDITRQLANYIKRLITYWPAEAGPPPAPEPPIDWEKHLEV